MILSAGFNRALDRSLLVCSCPPTRDKTLIAIDLTSGSQNNDARVRHAIDEAFLSGYRDVIGYRLGWRPAAH